MVFDKNAAICPDFKWFGFHISDLIWNPDHLQTNLLLNIPKSVLVCISDPNWNWLILLIFMIFKTTIQHLYFSNSIPQV